MNKQILDEGFKQLENTKDAPGVLVSMAKSATDDELVGMIYEIMEIMSRSTSNACFV